MLHIRIEAALLSLKLCAEAGDMSPIDKAMPQKTRFNIDAPRLPSCVSTMADRRAAE
jgi:hypothetical protein